MISYLFILSLHTFCHLQMILIGINGLGIERSVSKFMRLRCWWYGSLWPSRYSNRLQAGQSGDHILLGRDFPNPSTTTLRPNHTAVQLVPCFFPGVKQPNRGFDHPPQCDTVFKERVGLRLYFPSGLSWAVLEWSLPLFMLLTVRCSMYVHVSAVSMRLPWRFSFL